MSLSIEGITAVNVSSARFPQEPQSWFNLTLLFLSVQEMDGSYLLICLIYLQLLNNTIQ